MFIAHLPAGYLFIKSIQRTFRKCKYAWLGLIGSVLPDIDLLYFYFIDNRQTHHHEYWTHLPMFWAFIAVFVLTWASWSKHKEALFTSTIFFLTIFLHLLLDTYAGAIQWLYPFYNNSLTLIDVPAVYEFWVWNFVFHWSFLSEVAIILSATIILMRNKKKQYV